MAGPTYSRCSFGVGFGICVAVLQGLWDGGRWGFVWQIPQTMQRSKMWCKKVVQSRAQLCKVVPSRGDSLKSGTAKEISAWKLVHSARVLFRGFEKGLAGGGWRQTNPQKEPKKVLQKCAPLLLRGHRKKGTEKRPESLCLPTPFRNF